MKMSLNISCMPQWFKVYKAYIASILLLFVVYLVVYRNVIFAPYLIVGVDFQVPIGSANYSLHGLLSGWSPFGSGFPYGTNWGFYGGIVYGLFVDLSFGSNVLAQKLMFSGVLFASVFMYLFIIKTVTHKQVVAFTVALIYAYSAFTVNYGTGIVWEYAFFPLVLLFLFRLIGEKPRWVDATAFVITLDLLIGFGVHLLPFVALIALLFILLNLNNKGKITYLKRTFKYLGVSVMLFLLSAPAFTFSLVALLPVNVGLPGQTAFQSTVSIVNIEYFYINYQYMPLVNWLTPLQPYSPYIESIIPALAFVFPILAGLAVLNTQKHKLTIGFSLILVAILSLILLIYFESPVFEWLFYNFSPIRLYRGTEGFGMLISFIFAALTAISLEGVIKRFEH